MLPHTQLNFELSATMIATSMSTSERCAEALGGVPNVAVRKRFECYLPSYGTLWRSLATTTLADKSNIQQLRPSSSTHVATPEIILLSKEQEEPIGEVVSKSASGMCARLTDGADKENTFPVQGNRPMMNDGTTLNQDNHRLSVEPEENVGIPSLLPHATSSYSLPSKSPLRGGALKGNLTISRDSPSLLSAINNGRTITLRVTNGCCEIFNCDGLCADPVVEGMSDVSIALDLSSHDTKEANENLAKNDQFLESFKSDELSPSASLHENITAGKEAKIEGEIFSESTKDTLDGNLDMEGNMDSDAFGKIDKPSTNENRNVYKGNYTKNNIFKEEGRDKGCKGNDVVTDQTKNHRELPSSEFPIFSNEYFEGINDAPMDNNSEDKASNADSLESLLSLGPRLSISSKHRLSYEVDNSFGSSRETHSSQQKSINHGSLKDSVINTEEEKEDTVVKDADMAEPLGSARCTEKDGSEGINDGKLVQSWPVSAKKTFSPVSPIIAHETLEASFHEGTDEENRNKRKDDISIIPPISTGSCQSAMEPKPLLIDGLSTRGTLEDNTKPKEKDEKTEHHNTVCSLGAASSSYFTTESPSSMASAFTDASHPSPFQGTLTPTESSGVDSRVIAFNLSGLHIEAEKKWEKEENEDQEGSVTIRSIQASSDENINLTNDSLTVHSKASTSEEEWSDADSSDSEYTQKNKEEVYNIIILSDDDSSIEIDDEIIDVRSKEKEPDKDYRLIKRSNSRTPVVAVEKNNENQGGKKTRRIPAEGSDKKKTPNNKATSNSPKDISAQITSNQANRTPAVFRRERESNTRVAFKKFNMMVFDGALNSVEVFWSKKLITTAGLTRLKRVGPASDRQRLATIELSVKVIDSVDRLRSTLLHEMCHAAAWLIDGVIKPPHGPCFKKWAKLSMKKVSVIDILLMSLYFSDSTLYADTDIQINPLIMHIALSHFFDFLLLWYSLEYQNSLRLRMLRLQPHTIMKFHTNLHGRASTQSVRP